MSANTNQRADAVPEERCVRQIIAICAKHGIAYGSPDCLRGFILALHENKHLAMDFWSAVARMGDRDAVDAPDADWLLNVIVEGVTGENLAEARTAGTWHRMLLQQLASILAGEDVETPADRRPVQSARELRGGSASMLPRSAFEPEEMAPPPVRPDPVPDVRPLEFIASDSNTRRLSLEPDPPPAPHLPSAPTPDSDTGPPQLIIPLAAYADANHARVSTRLMGGVLLAAVLIGSLLLVTHYRERLNTSLRAGYSSAIATWNTPQGAQQPTSSQPTTALTSNSPAPASTPRPVVDSPNASISQASPQSGVAKTGPRHDSRLVHTVTASSEARAPASANPPMTSARVVVPEILMTQNLISSREPDDARGTSGAHERGRVVMQAIVNKRGQVEHVHILNGDPALRRAAIDKALSRHYRPYLLNGTPVDVSTTISVDF
jgi:protein TonB